ncbi:MAG: AI-2E family transporter [Hyphomicrobiaceae bacterium]
MTAPQDRTLAWMTIAVTLAFAWIVLPLYGAVLWAVVAAVVFAPVHRRLLVFCGQRRNAAAFATVLLIVAVVIVPLALAGTALLQEATDLYAKIKSGDVNLFSLFQQVLDGLPGWVSKILRNSGLSTLGTAQDKLSGSLAQSSQFLAAQVVNISQVTLELAVNLGVMIYLLFFLVRDGNAIFKRIGDAIPLRSEQKDALFQKFRIVIRATVKGDMLVALLQGSLGGLIFWVLAVPSPLLWTVLMAFLSLLPVVGAGIVWLPVAVYFFATGAIWKGVMLTAFGAVVIGLVDNILRPILVGGDTKMPEYIVLISTLGGIATLGLNGFILGPVIAAMFIAVWEIFSVRRHQFT